MTGITFRKAVISRQKSDWQHLLLAFKPEDAFSLCAFVLHERLTYTNRVHYYLRKLSKKVMTWSSAWQTQWLCSGKCSCWGFSSKSVFVYTCTNCWKQVAERKLAKSHWTELLSTACLKLLPEALTIAHTTACIYIMLLFRVITSDISFSHYICQECVSVRTCYMCTVAKLPQSVFWMQNEGAVQMWKNTRIY